MFLESEKDKLFYRYLLEEVTEGEKESLEFAIFQNEVLFNEFQFFEDDLVEIYLYDRGSLSKLEIDKIEKLFLVSSRLREKVESTKNLIGFYETKFLTENEKFGLLRFEIPFPSILQELKDLFKRKFLLVNEE